MESEEIYRRTLFCDERRRGTISLTERERERSEGGRDDGLWSLRGLIFHCFYIHYDGVVSTQPRQ